MLQLPRFEVIQADDVDTVIGNCSDTVILNNVNVYQYDCISRKCYIKVSSTSITMFC